MDDAPEILPIPEAEPAESEPIRVSAGALVRDASLDLVIAFGSGGILIMVLGITLTVMGLDPGTLLTSGWGIATLLLCTQLPLLYRALRRRRRNREKHRPELALFDGATSSAVVRGVLTGAALTILSGIYTGILAKISGPDAVQNQIDFLKDMLDDRVAVGVLVFLIAVMAPICEEIFFRGVVFGSARAVGMSKTGVALSAVLFAIVHLIPILAPFYAFFAVVMCWLYVRTGTLAAPMAAHMTMNGLACLGLLLQNNQVV